MEKLSAILAKKKKKKEGSINKISDKRELKTDITEIQMIVRTTTTHQQIGQPTRNG